MVQAVLGSIFGSYLAPRLMLSDRNEQPSLDAGVAPVAPQVFIAPAAMSRSLRNQKGLVRRRRATLEVVLTLRPCCTDTN